MTNGPVDRETERLLSLMRKQDEDRATLEFRRMLSDSDSGWNSSNVLSWTETVRRLPREEI